MSQLLYIGVDGGGTNTRVLVTDGQGRVLGRGLAGSTDVNHYPYEIALQNMRQAITQALADTPGEVRSVFLGMSVISTEADAEPIISIIREIPEVSTNARVTVVGDEHTGLIGGLSGRPGIVLVAGTGSVCFGMREDGQNYLCGGWGPLADDAGSAYWIGLKAIQAAVRAEDGRSGLDVECNDLSLPLHRQADALHMHKQSYSTTLREIVLDFLGISDPRQLIDRVHGQGMERHEIGLLAPRVIEAFTAGDATAGRIIQNAVEELSLLVTVVQSRLFEGAPCELCLVGGLALSGPPFQTLLTAQISRESPNVRVVTPEMSPVQGAVMEALRADGIPWSDSVLRNLRTTESREL